MDSKDVKFDFLDEILTLDLRRSDIEGYKIIVDEDICMVFGEGVWAQTLADTVFEKVNEYIQQLMQEGQTPNLKKKVSELFDEIGVKECNEEGIVIYPEKKLRRLVDFLSLKAEDFKDF